MLLISSMSIAAGCATAPKPPVPVLAADNQAFISTTESPASDTEAPASALVFDLPLARDMAHPELARADRQPAVFMGFDLPTVESYITATDNVSTDLGDFHVQESVVVKSGTRLR